MSVTNRASLISGSSFGLLSSSLVFGESLSLCRILLVRWRSFWMPKMDLRSCFVGCWEVCVEKNMIGRRFLQGISRDAV